jgi:alcohol dehydrogenase (NADP+)
LKELLPIYEAARIKPTVVQVESHPYLPETELLEFCKEKSIVFFGFCAVGPWNEARTARRSCDCGNRHTGGKTPAQVLLAWAVQRGTALLTTPKSVRLAREF